ncbi:hypothetical protein TNCV_2509991 [Trichonephila clavipes]|nr:hypothetical protein TNCV_2509991 [Trichonephila clavipes]
MADKDILELIQSSKNKIAADSDNENETNTAAPVPTQFEMRNIMKSRRISPTLLTSAWFGCHSKTIALTSTHFFKRSLMADVGIGPLSSSSSVQKETHFAVFLGVLHSKFLGVLLSSVHLHVPL